jgi:regulator of nucleoside diphosphate kinase
MRMLAGELVGARVAASTEIPPGKAKIGSTVRYRGGGPGQIVTVTLVYPEAEDRAASRISVLSPEGSALLGLSEGQSILYGTPAGRRKWLIVLRVVSQPAIEEARIGSRQGAPMATAEPELS